MELRVQYPHGPMPFIDRRANSLRQRRKRLPWPEDRPFRILSLDGGGIRGIYPATILSLIERELTHGAPLCEYFDLITGTSTGGIIAVGLGLGISAESISALYVQQGRYIFPPGWSGLESVFRRFLWMRQFLRYKYDSRALEKALLDIMGERLFGESHSRLVIPSFLAPKTQIAVLKTDHHPDFQNDWRMQAWEVARATSAAPTYFPGREYEGAVFLDGGVWANNPLMTGIIDALSAFDISREQLRCISIGTGNAPYEISLMAARGGFWRWREIISAAVFLTTDNATAQAELLIGPEHIVRLEPDDLATGIELDDWKEAVKFLPDLAARTFAKHRQRLEPFFDSKILPRERFYSTDPRVLTPLVVSLHPPSRLQDGGNTSSPT